MQNMKQEQADLRTWRLSELDARLDLGERTVRWLDRLARTGTLDTMVGALPEHPLEREWAVEVALEAAAYSDGPPHPAVIAAMLIRRATGQAPIGQAANALVSYNERYDGTKHALPDAAAVARAELVGVYSESEMGTLQIPEPLACWVFTGRFAHPDAGS